MNSPATMKRGGGGKLRPASFFLDFDCMIRNCGFMEFPYLRDWLSWRGWRDKKPIRCRLDRALGIQKWNDLFSNTTTEYLPMVGSDHKPIIAFMAEKKVRRKWCFMFDKRWVGKEGLLDAISGGWSGGSHYGSGAFVNKLINCRHAIS